MSDLSKAAAAMGRRGGRAGRGEVKARALMALTPEQRAERGRAAALKRWHPEPGWYGTAAETILVDRAGVAWLVQTPDRPYGADPERLKSMPAGFERLPDSVCMDVMVPEGAEW